MSTGLQATTLDLAECLKRGEAIMREAGLTRNLQVLQVTVYGEQGEYTASVRCVPGKEMVFFVVAGPRPTGPASSWPTSRASSDARTCLAAQSGAPPGARSPAEAIEQDDVQHEQQDGDGAPECGSVALDQRALAAGLEIGMRPAQILHQLGKGL